MDIELKGEVDLAFRISSRFFGESDTTLCPIVGKGSVNKVYVAKTAHDRAVVRMSDRINAFDEYQKEAWCIERAAKLGVPVTAVLEVGAFEAHSYMIQSYISGEDGRDSSLPPSEIWRELGRFARLIHSISVAGFGLELADMNDGDSQSSWLRYLNYNIESLNEDDELIRLGVLTPERSRVVKTIFEKLRETAFNFGLNHGDISLKNVIIDDGGRVNLLDWGSAEASIVPHHDLIQLLKMKMIENDPDDAAIGAFMDGYGFSQAEFDQMMPTLESLLLLRAFDKLRWAIDCEIDGLDDFVVHAKQASVRKFEFALD